MTDNTERDEVDAATMNMPTQEVRSHWEYLGTVGRWVRPAESNTPDLSIRCAEELGTAYRHVVTSIQTFAVECGADD